MYPLLRPKNEKAAVPAKKPGILAAAMGRIKDNSKLGVVKNTILGLPQATKKVVATGRDLLVKSPAEALLIRPALRTGEALGAGAAKLGSSISGNPEYYKRALDTIDRDKQVSVPGTKLLTGGSTDLGRSTFRRTAGEALESASYLYAPTKAVKAVSPILRGADVPIRQVISNISRGALGGYMGDVGIDLQGNGSMKEALKPGLGTLFGAAVPSIAGGYQGGRAILQNMKRLTPERPTLSPYLAANRSGIPAEAYGGVAGLEFEEDENGERHIKFNPTKAALGIAGAGALKRFGKPGETERLIAEGKVRVKARDGKPVYEYKADNEWRVARDAEDAAHQVARQTHYKISADGVRIGYSRRDLEVLREAENARRATSESLPRQQQEPQYQSDRRASKMPGQEYGTSQDLKDLPRESGGILSRTGAREDLPSSRRVSFQPSPDLSQDFSERRESLSRKLSIGEVRSLEIASEAAASRPNLVDDPSNFSLDKIVEQTPLKNKVSALDYLRTPEHVLKKIGLGDNARELRYAQEQYLKELPENINKITEWSQRISKYRNQALFKFLDGQAVDLNPEELKVAREIQRWMQVWAERLKLPQDNRIGHYITHIFEDQLIKREFDEDLAKIIADKIPGGVYDPFLQKRLGIKGYVEDTWRALDAYVKRATRKVHMDPALERLEEVSSKLEESQWDYVKAFADRVNMRPTKWDNRFDNAIKQTKIGYRLGQRPVANISRLLRQMTFRGMLGGNIGSAVRNLSQGVNTYAKLGEKYTVIGYSKLFTNGLDELKKVGVLNDAIVQDRTLSSTRKFMERLDKGLFLFFDAAEKINRGAAYYGAKSKALKEGKTMSQAIEYAKKIVRDTQFNYGAIDTPVLMNSDVAKVMFQFMTYPVKQTEFLSSLIKNKEYAALARYAVGGFAFTYTIGKTLGMEPEELIPWLDYVSGDRKFGTPPSLKTPAALIGAIADAPDQYGNSRDWVRKTKDVGKEALGLVPAGIQARKTWQGYQFNRDGGSFDKSGRLQFEASEGILPKAQALMFGKYANKNAKDYFEKMEGGNRDSEVQRFETEESERKEVSNKAAYALHRELSTLPPEESNARVAELYATDRAAYNKLRDIIEEERLGLTDLDKQIKGLGVESGARARYIYSQLEKLGTPEEKNSYLENLWKKKILTKDVMKQVSSLVASEQTP